MKISPGAAARFECVRALCTVIECVVLTSSVVGTILGHTTPYHTTVLAVCKYLTYSTSGNLLLSREKAKSVKKKICEKQISMTTCCSKWSENSDKCCIAHFVQTNIQSTHRWSDRKIGNYFCVWLTWSLTIYLACYIHCKSLEYSNNDWPVPCQATNTVHESDHAGVLSRDFENKFCLLRAHTDTLCGYCVARKGC